MAEDVREDARDAAGVFPAMSDAAVFATQGAINGQFALRARLCNRRNLA